MFNNMFKRSKVLYRSHRFQEPSNEKNFWSWMKRKEIKRLKSLYVKAEVYLESNPASAMESFSEYT